MSEQRDRKDQTEGVARLDLSETAAATLEIAEALRFLTQSPGGTESAIRLNEEYDAVTGNLRQSIAAEIAECSRYGARPNEAASAYFARPVLRV